MLLVLLHHRDNSEKPSYSSFIKTGEMIVCEFKIFYCEHAFNQTYGYRHGGDDIEHRISVFFPPQEEVTRPEGREGKMRDETFESATREILKPS